jgi:hypothetical protein
MARLKLSKEEKDKLLQGIDEAERRLASFEGEMTEADARSLLKDTVEEAITDILRNHKSERLLT